MAIMLNGFDVLQRIGSHPDVFAKVRADVDKQARALVVKCLKHDLDAMREIYKALGQEPFGLVVEGLKYSEIRPFWLGWTSTTRMSKAERRRGEINI